MVIINKEKDYTVKNTKVMSEFKSRKELKKERGVGYTNITEALKDFDTSNMEEIESRDTKVNYKKGKEYTWLRIITEDVIEMDSEDMVTLEYVPTGEKIEIPFRFYDKKGVTDNQDEDVIDYTSEEDKTSLCFLVDIDMLDNNSDDIPNIRRNFKASKYFEEDFFLKSDFTITINKTEEQIKYLKIYF